MELSLQEKDMMLNTQFSPLGSLLFEYTNSELAKKMNATVER